MRFSKPLTTLTAALLAAAGLAGCNSAPQRPEQTAAGDYAYAIDYLSWFIEQGMAESDTVGLSIALVDGDRTVWARGFGLAHREKGIAADEHTLYRVGSLAKPLVATAALRLAEQGRLDLDAPIETYLPRFRIGSRFSDSRPITPRLLLTHHAGLPMDRIAGMWSDRPHFFTDLPGQLGDEELAAEPGTVFAYSNLGYSLMGAVIQNACGEPFERCLQQQVLQPAGMVSAGFSAYPPQGPHAAPAYSADREEARRQYPLRDVPAGGLNAGVGDLARYMSALLAAGSPLNSTAAEMWRVQNAGLALDAGLELGLGWIRSRIPGAGLLVQHGGATPQHRAYLGMLPESGLGVVVLSNTDKSTDTVMATGRKALQLAWEAKTGRRLPESDGMQAEAVPSGYRYGLDDFIGHFDTQYGFAAVQREGDRLAVELNGQELLLEPLGEGRFKLKGRILGLIPAELDEVGLAVTEVAGRRLLLAREEDGGFGVIGEALRPVPVSPLWRARLGEYRILQPEGLVREWAKSGRIHVRMRDGFLLAETEGADGIELALVLEPLSDDRALVRGIGTNRGQVLRVLPAEGREEVRYSGLRLQRL
jgi:CubicO group peptidase (beta-lactamase class C family)